MPSETRRSWVQRARRAAFAVLWSVLAAEMFLRVLAPVAFLPRYVDGTDFGVRCNSASLSYWHSTPEYRVQIRTNARGIRADREFPYEKPAGTRRIVVLGDSYGLGYGVDLEDTFLAEMQRRLGAAGADCEVINLSVSGFGNAEELIQLQNEGFRYEPDLVLVAWHSSDFTDNIRSNLFKLDASGGVERVASSYLPGLKLRKRLAGYSAYRWIAGNSHLYVWSREFLARVVKAALFRLKKGSNDEPAGPADAPWEARFYPNPFEATGELTIAILRTMKSECRARGAELLILDIPDHSSRTDFNSRFPRSPDGASFDLDVVSPLQLFDRERGNVLFWERSHRHMTPLACRMTGEVLADRILETGILAD
ncbi:MAG: hypothetical protein ACI8QZ_003148 [Chlamydiales bacterium]